MNAEARLRDAGPEPFDPATGEILKDDRWSGKRRKFERQRRLLWKLPLKNRRASFGAWKKVANRILHEAGVSFRLISILEEVFFWKEALTTATDFELAAWGGGCSVKTVSRELKQYDDLGVIQIERGWRKKGGKVVRTRTIRLALPPKLVPAQVDLSDCEFDTDHSGPDIRAG
jgi:hypothetical protein